MALLGELDCEGAREGEPPMHSASSRRALKSVCLCFPNSYLQLLLPGMDFVAEKNKRKEVNSRALSRALQRTHSLTSP